MQKNAKTRHKNTTKQQKHFTTNPNSNTTLHKDMSLKIHIDRAYNIQAMDLNGKSDPYVIIFIKNAAAQNGNKSEKVAKTKVIKKTLDPVWNETFDINLKDVSIVGDGYDATGRDLSVEFQIFDRDLLNADDHMCTVEVKLDRLLRTETCQSMIFNIV